MQTARTAIRPLILAILCLLASGLCAEDAAPPKEEKPAPKEEKPAPKPVELDDGAKQALDKWDKLAYHLGREGITKAQYAIKATLVNPSYPKPISGTATYTWDAGNKDQQASLAWESEAIGALLRTHGWSAQSLSDVYDPEYLRRALAGAKLAAKADGERTILKVEGESASGYRELGFNKEGVLDAVTLELPGRDGIKLVSRIQFAYEQQGGKYLCTEQKSVLELPGRGAIETLMRFTHGKSGNYHVRLKAGMQAKLDGQPLGHSELEFSEYKFNADVK